MGTGKTEVGRQLAEILGLEFVDTDLLIEELEGMTVTGIFQTRGEEYFRAREEEICAKLSKRSGLVIATGGGTLLNEKTFAAFSQTGQIILLTASVDMICTRIRESPLRPLLLEDKIELPDDQFRERILRILSEREPVYRRIRTRVDTTYLNPHEAAVRIASSINIPSRTINIRVPAGSIWARPSDTPQPKGRKSHTALSTIEIGCGVLSKLGDRLKSLGLTSGAFLIVPNTIWELYLDQIAASLDAVSIPYEKIFIHDGDSEKTLEQVSKVIEELASHGAERDSVIVAMGGGVTGDIGGFAASTYMRGIPLVHVPTTLLAQVDSSIGGKVGVNHAWAKNLIGSFYQPLLVLTDPCLLRTLPIEEISSGMAEVVKTAIIGSPNLFDFIERKLHEYPSDELKQTSFLERCITECAAIKASIVEKDPFDQDERKILNLGHTLGHALEAVGEYFELSHGEAVSIGLVAAVRIAVSRGLVDEEFLRRTMTILNRCGLPVTAPPYNEKSIAQSLHLDKKKQSGRFHFVLPVRIGSIMAARVVTDVSEAEMLAALWKGAE